MQLYILLPNLLEYSICRSLIVGGDMEDAYRSVISQGVDSPLCKHFCIRNTKTDHCYGVRFYACEEYTYDKIEKVLHAVFRGENINVYTHSKKWHEVTDEAHGSKYRHFAGGEASPCFAVFDSDGFIRIYDIEYGGLKTALQAGIAEGFVREMKFILKDRYLLLRMADDRLWIIDSFQGTHYGWRSVDSHGRGSLVFQKAPAGKFMSNHKFYTGDEIYVNLYYRESGYAFAYDNGEYGYVDASYIAW